MLPRRASAMKAPASRNAPCPCGSGRRYKECHGALAPSATADADLTAAAAADPRALVARALDAVSRNDLLAAERAARAVLDVDPIHPDAWHVIALVALARREFPAALEACERAIAVLPQHAPFHASRARALLELGPGRRADAARSARRASELAPDDAATWTLLGRTLLAPDAASDAAGDATTERKASVADSAGAEAAFRRALALEATDAEAMFYLGDLCRRRGETAAAIRIFEEALAHHPHDALLQNNLGLALEASGDVDGASARYVQALAAPGAPAEAHANLARLLQRRQDFPGAATHYHAYVTQVAGAPAEIWSNLAACQHKLGAYAVAEESYRRAAELAPDSITVEFGLSALLVEQGRSEEAIRRLAALRERAPSGHVIHSLLTARQLICDWTDWAETVAEVRGHIERVARGEDDTLIPLNALALPLSPAEQLVVARRFAGSYRAAATHPLPRLQPPPRGRRLRLGYVSSDFRLHPIAYLLTELWERHDRDRFEVFAYSIGPGEDSPLRTRIERAFEHFVDVDNDSAERTTQRIRTDGIQILIDLNGYTSGSRTEIFVPRAAPVQMHWLGFLGTLGADWIDYVVTDRYATPPQMQARFTERFLYLPDGYTPSDTRRPVDPRPQSRAEQGLPGSAIVFCCFNNAYKIVPPMFDAWMRILSAIPDSVLWLSPSSDATYANLRREARARGVDPARLVFAPRVDLATYLARLRLADLFLDTWPYNAGTTANDALLVGLPIITCAGETMASRVAASQLHTMGMPELVTHDLAGYEALAIALARAPARLAGLRERLRELRERSPLFDMARYTRGFEDALADAWVDHERRSRTATS